jgi:hypothetical protein
MGSTSTQKGEQNMMRPKSVKKTEDTMTEAQKAQKEGLHKMWCECQENHDLIPEYNHKVSEWNKSGMVARCLLNSNGENII